MCECKDGLNQLYGFMCLNNKHQSWLRCLDFVIGSRDSSIALWSTVEAHTTEDRNFSTNIHLTKRTRQSSPPRHESESEDDDDPYPERLDSYYSMSDYTGFSSTEEVSNHTCLKDVARKYCQDKDKVRALQVNEFKKVGMRSDLEL